MNDSYERELAQMQWNRSTLGEAELRKSVATNPDSAAGHASLALYLATQGQVEEAEPAARYSLQLDPKSAFAHYVQAFVLRQTGRLREAETAAREATRLDLSNVLYFALLAVVRLELGDYDGALRAAGNGLGRDPTDAMCLNVRARALLILGHTTEAGTAAEALSQDSNDAAIHATRGWAALCEHQPAKALDAFREALRLDPTDEAARNGMVEALKSQYWIYRQMLRFFLWMGWLSTGRQWAVIIGLIVVQQSLAAIARNNPILRPFVQPALYVLVGFVLLCWLADPLFNLLLRLNRFGRFLLTPEEIRQSNWIGGAIVTGLVGVLIWVAAPFPYWSYGRLWAAGTLITLIPLAATFRCEPGWPRRLMACYTAGIVLGVVVSLFCLVIATQQTSEVDLKVWVRRSNIWFIGAAVASFFGALLANGLFLSRR